MPARCTSALMWYRWVLVCLEREGVDRTWKSAKCINVHKDRSC